MAKPVEEATSVQLAFVSIVEWVIFFFLYKTKRMSFGESLTVVQTEITREPITCYPNP